jgi:hypothetical protein
MHLNSMLIEGEIYKPVQYEEKTGIAWFELLSQQQDGSAIISVEVSGTLAQRIKDSTTGEFVRIVGFLRGYAKLRNSIWLVAEHIEFKRGLK